MEPHVRASIEEMTVTVQCHHVEHEMRGFCGEDFGDRHQRFEVPQPVPHEENPILLLGRRVGLEEVGVHPMRHEVDLRSVHELGEVRDLVGADDYDPVNALKGLPRLDKLLVSLGRLVEGDKNLLVRGS